MTRIGRIETKLKKSSTSEFIINACIYCLFLELLALKTKVQGLNLAQNIELILQAEKPPINGIDLAIHGRIARRQHQNSWCLTIITMWLETKRFNRCSGGSLKLGSGESYLFNIAARAIQRYTMQLPAKQLVLAYATASTQAGVI